MIIDEKGQKIFVELSYDNTTPLDLSKYNSKMIILPCFITSFNGNPTTHNVKIINTVAHGEALVFTKPKLERYKISGVLLKRFNDATDEKIFVDGVDVLKPHEYIKWVTDVCKLNIPIRLNMYSEDGKMLFTKGVALEDFPISLRDTGSGYDFDMSFIQFNFLGTTERE